MIEQPCAIAAWVISSQHVAMVGSRNWRSKIGRIAASAMPGNLEQTVVVSQRVLIDVECRGQRPTHLGCLTASCLLKVVMLGVARNPRYI